MSRDYRAEVDAMPKGELVGLLEQAAQVLSDAGDDCRGLDEEASYRLECETVLRAAEMLRNRKAGKTDLSRVSTLSLAMELQRRQECKGDFAGDIVPCLSLVITPEDFAEAANLSIAPEDWEALSDAFYRWQDNGGYADIMQTMINSHADEQARQLSQKGGAR